MNEETLSIPESILPESKKRVHATAYQKLPVPRRIARFYRKILAEFVEQLVELAPHARRAFLNMDATLPAFRRWSVELLHLQQSYKIRVHKLQARLKAAAIFSDFKYDGDPPAIEHYWQRRVCVPNVDRNPVFPPPQTLRVSEIGNLVEDEHLVDALAPPHWWQIAWPGLEYPDESHPNAAYDKMKPGLVLHHDEIENRKWYERLRKYFDAGGHPKDEVQLLDADDPRIADIEARRDSDWELQFGLSTLVRKAMSSFASFQTQEMFEYLQILTAYGFDVKDYARNISAITWPDAPDPLQDSRFASEIGEKIAVALNQLDILRELVTRRHGIDAALAYAEEEKSTLPPIRSFLREHLGTLSSS